MISNTIQNPMTAGAGRSEIEENVLRAIRSGEVKMLPKWRFTLRIGLGIIGALLLFFMALAATTLVIVALQGAGLAGLRAFLPWALLVLSIGLVIAIGAILEQYTIAYYQPFLYVLLLLVVVVALAAAAISATSLGQGFASYATANFGEIGVIHENSLNF